MSDMSTGDGRADWPEKAARLYRDHARTVRAFVAARVRDPGAVDDIVQETFLVPPADGAVPPDAEGRWLVGVARNKVLKHMRDRGETAVAEPGIASSEPEPAHALGEDEERERVRRAVRSLDEELREVILLRYEGGLDYRAIADRL